MLKKYLLPAFAVLTLAACKQGGQSKSEAHQPRYHALHQRGIHRPGAGQQPGWRLPCPACGIRALQRTDQRLLPQTRFPLCMDQRRRHHRTGRRPAEHDAPGCGKRHQRQHAEQQPREHPLRFHRADGRQPQPKGYHRIRCRAEPHRAVFVYANKVWGGMTSDNAKDLEWFIPRKKDQRGKPAGLDHPQPEESAGLSRACEPPVQAAPRRAY